MPDTNEVTTQPAPTEQIAVEQKGAANIGVAEFVRRMTTQVAPAADKATNAKEVEATAETPSTEESVATPEDADKASTEVTTEEPAEEAKAEPEGDEEKADEALSHETNSLDPKLQAKIDRRIGKEVAKRKGLEAKIAELEAKVLAIPVAEEKPVIVPVPSNQPLAEINDLATLEQLKQTAMREIFWAEAQLDDDDFPKEGKMTDRGFATKADLKTLIRNAKQCQTFDIPAREKFLQSKTTAEQAAFEKFKFLKDPTAPEYQIAKQTKKDNPWLHSIPNADYILGVMIKGQQALAAEEAAKAKPAAKATVKPKPKPTSGQADITSDSSATRAPIGALKQQAMDNETSQLRKRGSVSVNEYAAYLTRQAQLKSTR